MAGHFYCMEKVRIDKWLWSVRIFKSRTMATNACKTNKVFVDDMAVKPSFLIQEQMTVEVKKEGYLLTFKVLKLLSKRVGAPIAITCYEDLTPVEEKNKFKDWYVYHSKSEIREKGLGRPTKRDRRDIDHFKWGPDDNET